MSDHGPTHNGEASKPLADWRDAEIERLRGLLSEARESVFQDIERMRESGVYEPDLGATIALLHNIDTYVAERATDQPDECPSCGRSTKRHPGYVIGNHWLESAYERICVGEAEDEVLLDYGVCRINTEAK